MRRSVRSRSCPPGPPPWFWCTLLATFCSLCTAADPAPLAVPVSPNFLGDDGHWSPIVVGVGSPPQYFNVLPNTASQETWVVGPGGCDTSYTCQLERGGLFYASQSSTFKPLGAFRLGVDPQFDISDYADYGLDTITLTDQGAVNGQIIGVLNRTDFWLGQFGLGVDQTQFSNTTKYLTVLSSLVEEAGLIPSHSYGYTAGAYYRLASVPASLTLGGVDKNRFTPNTASYNLNPDQKPTLAVDKITVSASSIDSPSSPQWSANPLALLDGAEKALFTIDSSTPFLWMPESVCNAFADALGLVYDESLGLYLFSSNGTSPETLSSWGLSFTFALSDYPGSSSNVITLSLPYSAFNLQLSYPFPNLAANFTSAPTNYFPLRKAIDPTQYTLGRAFLQETYLTVDFERNNFSISQALFSANAMTNLNLAAITRPSNSNFTGPYQPTHPTSNIALKAGVGVAIAVVVLTFAALCWYFFLFRKHKQAEKGRRLNDKESPSSLEGDHSELAGDTNAKFSELPASRRFPTEAPVDPTQMRVEAPGNVPIEMPAVEEVPTAFYASNSDGKADSKNDARNPVELSQLQQRGSISKSMLMMPSDHGRGEGIARLGPPPYSPSSGDGHASNGVSPNSLHNSSCCLGSNSTSSSDRIVSPVSSGHSRDASGLHSPAVFSPLEAPAAANLPMRLQSPMQLDGYRIRGASPGNSLRTSALLQAQRVDLEAGMELTDRPPEARRERFSWEGSEA